VFHLGFNRRRDDAGLRGTGHVLNDILLHLVWLFFHHPLSGSLLSVTIKKPNERFESHANILHLLDLNSLVKLLKWNPFHDS